MKSQHWRIAKDFREKLLLLLAGIALYLLIDRWGRAWEILSWVLGILSPFFAGIGIAYLLDIPVRALESHGVKKRGVAVLISVVLAGALVTFLITQMVPGLVESVQILLKNLPYSYDSATALVGRLSIRLGLPDYRCFAPDLECCVGDPRASGCLYRLQPRGGQCDRA